ncbi:MAG: hypothetical protein K2M91_05910 [Lachnospiraceae bacterium]|nr:hypothetical protein [Lachnospiraceae bacterium]
MADMEQERFRWRVMDGTNFYRVQALKSFIASYDSVYDETVENTVPEDYTSAMT